MLKTRFSYAELRDRVGGAWLGRCAGCLLGKPVEGYQKDRIRIAAESGLGYPLNNYFAAIANPPAEIAERDWSPGNASLLEGIKGMARDDDTDYTLLGLQLMEAHGPAMTTEHVAEAWLAQFPYHKVYTAERVAYRNLVDGLAPPQTATWRNPCREWIGAQIRADAFGYVFAGQPGRAAEIGYRDARLSHTKNGIYGEMFIAAATAAAFTVQNPREAIEIGLSEIPKDSRLAACIRDIITQCENAGDWDVVSDHINERYAFYQGCHTITNAAVVTLALLMGESDFEKTITIAIMAGHDTDCNGATAGSIMAAMLGEKALPAKWTAPLQDTLYSALVDTPVSRISELAERTTRLAARLMTD